MRMIYQQTIRIFSRKNEGIFVPSAKLVGDRHYSIISDYLGTSVEVYDEEGQRVWPQELDIYGQTRSEEGVVGFIPFFYQGQ
jgi:rhs family protein